MGDRCKLARAHLGFRLQVLQIKDLCCLVGFGQSVAVGTVGTLVPATLCLCAYMLLVPHWYCSLYVLVLLLLLVQWYQPLYVSVSICYWYHTGTALYMYWYCCYCWYTGTIHSMSLCQYVTGTTRTGRYCSLYVLVLLVLGTVGTLVPATLSLCLYVIGTTLVLLFICTGTVGTVGTLVPATLSLCLYVIGTTLVLLFICTGTVGTVGTLVPATICLYSSVLVCLCA